MALVARPKASPGFLAAVLAVGAAVCVAYANHFDNPFELDDMHTIVQNEAIRDLANLPRFFTDPSTFSTLPANQVYRPGTTTLNALDVYLGGTGRPEPRAFHRSIFAAHLALGVALYFFLALVLRRSFDRPWVGWVALAGAALFLLHTANAETVNYVIARADSFQTLMVVLGFVVYLGRPAWRRFLLYLVPVVVGFLVKEPAVMFAPLLFLHLLIFKEPQASTKRWLQDGLRVLGRAAAGALPAFVLSAALFALSRAMTPSGFSPGGTDRLRYLLTQPFVVFHYFANFFLPVNLAVESDWEPFANVFDDRVLAGLLFVAFAVAFAVRMARRPEGRPVAFGLLWFFAALAPTSSVIPLAEVLNDHRPFFGYVGLTLALCGLLSLGLARHEDALARSAAGRGAIVAVVVLLLGAHAFGVRARNQVWSSSESLWGEAARKSPGSGRVLMNYGLTLMARGDYAGAILNFDKARAVWPNYSYIHINLGVAEEALGNPAKAEGHFRDALGLDPRNPEGYAYYAPFLRKQGREAEARDVAQRGLSLSPGHLGLKAFLAAPAPPTATTAATPAAVATPAADATPESLLDTSLALYRAGRYQESLHTAQRAAALRPDWDLAWNNVCAAYNSLGRWDEAIAAGEKAVRLNPANAYAKGNLDWARRQKAARAPAP